MLFLQKSNFSALATHFLQRACTWEVSWSQKIEFMFRFADFFRARTAACEKKNFTDVSRRLGGLSFVWIQEGESPQTDQASFHTIELHSTSATSRGTLFQMYCIMKHAASVLRHD
jgi:hypothetical protein